MIVPSMNWRELKTEVARDHDIIRESTTLHRLIDEYHRERRQKRIKPEDPYTVFRRFKTKAKNLWMARLSLSRESERYRSPDDTGVACYAYHRVEESYRVIHRGDSGMMAIFNGHLFKRYRERMEFEPSDPLTIIERFLTNNQDMNFKVMEDRDGYRQLIGFVKEGFLLGEYLQDEGIYLNRTFINTRTANGFHQESVRELEASMLKGMLNPEGGLSDMHEELNRMYRMAGFGEDMRSIDQIHRRLEALGGDTDTGNIYMVR